MDRDGPIVLYDGVCNLCDASVRFIIKHDRKGIFRFAALQSDVGRELGSRCEEDVSGLRTIMLLEKGRCHARSDAALLVARRLSGGWSVLTVFMLVPRPLRDWVYGFVARNRYRWFGRTDSCHVPDADYRARFLDLDDHGVPIVSIDPGAG